MSELVYILEDDQDVAAIFARALEQEGFTPELFRRIADFRRALAHRRPALSILDLGLPDGDAAELLGREIAAAGAPTIIVSGRSALEDKLLGLEGGAEDYVVKPVDPAELVARARIVLRRRTEAASAARDEIAEFAGWRANFATYRLTAPEGDDEALSQADAVLLRGFLEAPGRVLSRSALLDLCGAIGQEAFDRAIDVRVSRLRKKLRDDPKKPELIKTVYGAGYVFAAEVRWS